MAPGRRCATGLRRSPKRPASRWRTNTAPSSRSRSRTLASAAIPPPETEQLPIEARIARQALPEGGRRGGGPLRHILGGNAVVAKALDSFLGGLAAGDPTYFCQLPGATSTPPSSACDGASSSSPSSGPSAPSDDGGGSGDAGATAKAACLDAAAHATGSTPLSGSASDYAPAQVRAGNKDGKGGWYNGIAESQIASVLTANSKATTFANYDPKLVSIAGQGKVKTPAPSLASGQTESWAQAEFFYDAPGAWSGDDAMWNFYWRARFRATKSSALPKVAGDAIDVAATSYDTTTATSDVTGLSTTNIYTGPAKLGLTQALTDTSHNPTID